MSKAVERTEVLHAEPAHALADMLGRTLPADRSLPPLWHWLYHLDRPSLRDLGRDGHALRNALPTPPGPGQRRMFAGGRLLVHRPLRLERPALRRSVARPPVVKEGRSGQLTFVTVRTEIYQDGLPALTEEQDVVYLRSERSTAATGADVPVASAAGDEGWLVPDEVLLFRFSALTYNTHRIHYDRQYAQQVEGYPDLVVHGPLQALYLADWIGNRSEAPVSRLEFRFLTQVFVGQPLVVRSDRAAPGPDAPTDVAVIPAADGRTAATMRAWRTRSEVEESGQRPHR